ncbi:MAG: CBS domain-containing protein [Candidatus Omnitrophota bacterium]
MSTVKELLQEKGSHIFSIEPDASVYEALRIMATKDVGALVVMKQGKMVGIFSERDYARHSIEETRNNAVIPVSDLMTPDVITAGSDWAMEKCMALMVENHIRHLPVVENDRLIGMITLGDVSKRLISKLK